VRSATQPHPRWLAFRHAAKRKHQGPKLRRHACQAGLLGAGRRRCKAQPGRAKPMAGHPPMPSPVGGRLRLGRAARPETSRCAPQRPPAGHPTTGQRALISGYLLVEARSSLPGAHGWPDSLGHAGLRAPAHAFCRSSRFPGLAAVGCAGRGMAARLTGSTSAATAVATVSALRFAGGAGQSPWRERRS